MHVVPYTSVLSLTYPSLGVLTIYIRHFDAWCPLRNNSMKRVGMSSLTKDLGKYIQNATKF